MKWATLIIASCCVYGAAQAAGPSTNTAQIAAGRKVFEHVCAACHGQGPGTDGAPMLPGTQALTKKCHGQVPGALELRSDLDARVLRHFLRNGSGTMPMFRKTEISDSQIEAVATYLSWSAARTAAKGKRAH